MKCDMCGCLENRIKDLETALLKADKGLEFYGNRDNYNHVDNGRGYDMYYIDNDYSFEMGRGECGGKNAREIRVVINEVIKEIKNV